MVIYYQKEDDGFMVIHQLINESQKEDLETENIFAVDEPEHLKSEVFLRGNNHKNDFIIVPCDHEKKFKSKLMIKYNFNHVIKF